MDDIGMCKAPYRLVRSQGQPSVLVACGQCRQCKGNRVNDFAGRAVAELMTSDASLSLTLTYADSLHAATLHYRDVQLMLKHLRNDGYAVRYLCCGEFGEKKGRAHWHVILFFRGASPEFDYRTKFYNWKYWPHGYTYAQSPDFDGMCYVLKYTLKDETSRAYVKVLRLSKKPPLGYDYFQSLAQRLVDARLAVQSPEYAFGHVRLRNGTLRRFWLTGRSRELFLEAYVRKWRDATGAEPPKHEFLWGQYYDPIAAREGELSPEQFARELATRPLRRPVEFNPLPDAPKQLGFLMLSEPVDAVLCVYSNGLATLAMEDYTWPREIGIGSVVIDLAEAGVPHSLGRQVLDWWSGLLRRYGPKGEFSAVAPR